MEVNVISRVTAIIAYNLDESGLEISIYSEYFMFIFWIFLKYHFMNSEFAKYCKTFSFQSFPWLIQKIWKFKKWTYIRHMSDYRGYRPAKINELVIVSFGCYKSMCLVCNWLNSTFDTERFALNLSLKFILNYYAKI